MFNPISKRNKWFNLAMTVILLVTMMFPASLPVGNVKQAAAAASIANHVVISQVYIGNGSSTYKNRYVELYNPTNNPVDLNTWSLQSTSGKGTSYVVTKLSGSIPAYGYYLIQCTAQSNTIGLDLPTPDATVTGNVNFGATAAKLALVTTQTAITKSSDPGVRDFIGYGTTANVDDSFTSPAAAPANVVSQAFFRKTNTGLQPDISGDGNGWDSLNNKNDFVQTTANPRNSSYPTGTAASNLNEVAIGSLLGNNDFGIPINLGKSASITGVATVDDKVLGTDNTSFYLQDATGGINVFNVIASSVVIKKGNKYQVAGRLMFTKGQSRFLLSSVLDLGPDSLPAPQTIKISDLTTYSSAESLEGKLVKFYGKVNSITKLADTTISIVDESSNAASVTILGSLGIDIDLTLNSGSSYTFTGILGQSKDSAPYKSGYFLMPRSVADIRGELTLKHDPLLKVISGVNLPFSVISKNADSVTLYYKAKGELNYRAPISLFSADNLNYNGTISSDLVPSGGLIYEIVARSDGKSLTAGPYTIDEGDDKEGPTFSNPLPANADSIETKHPVISVTMSDLSGVDTSSAKISIDNVDFTSKATITDNQIKLTITSDLSEGPHTVVVQARDTVNNLSSYSWTFTVAKRFVGGEHYRGTTHNHTNISHDAVGTPETALKEAMKYDYDFFAFSDHSHDIDPCPTDPISKKIVCTDTVDHGGMPERLGGVNWATTKNLAATYNQNNPNKFVVFPAFEMTSTTWGHSNVFGTDDFIDRMQDGGKYQTLQNYYAWTMTYDNIVAQFNHPNAPANSFDNFIPYNKTLDKLFTLLEVGNGSGQYSYSNTQDKFFTALDIGWHVAPTYGEDNHDASWGQTKRRTVIVADSLNQKSLLESMRDMHVYMSEDPNAKLDVMASGWYMGSITDTKSLQFDINVSDPVLEDKSNPKYSYLLPSITQNDNISKIELVSNGGRVVNSIDLSSLNTTSYNWKPDEITVSGGQQWFVVRVTQKDKDQIFSAPIWTPTDPLNVKVTSVVAEGGAITGGVPVKLTAGISNMGVVNVTDLTASFYVDEPILTNKIGEVKIESLLKNKSANAEVIWANPIAGLHNITVVLTTGDGNDLGTNKFNQSYNIKPSLGMKILIDASHKNEGSSKDTGTNVNNLQTFTTLMRKEGYLVVENAGTNITSAELTDVKILILTHPASTYSTSEITAVKDFINSGGSIYLSENSNNQTLNTLLSGIGSKILFNKDTVYDDTAYGNFWSPPLANEYKVKAHPAPMDNYLTDFVNGLDFYSGTSLTQNNGLDVKEALIGSSDLSILVSGNETSFQQSAPSGVFNYKVGTGATGGSKIPLVAAEKVNNGRLIVAGMNLFNDNQLKGTNDNIQFALNTINWLAHREPKVISIGEARTKAVDTAVVVQGKVTSAAGGFYDAVYVQDDTGGIMAFNEVPPGSLNLGDTIRVYGHIQVFEDNFELIFDKFANSIVKIRSGSPIQPKNVSTAASVSTGNMGQLVKVFGTVVDIPDGSSYVIDDGSGPVLVFVDGYIISQSGVPVPDLKIGDKLVAIGLSGGYSGGTRIRVRDTSELKKTDTLNPVTGVSLSENSITMLQGDPAVTLTASIQPSNATYTSVIWTSNNEAVAKVNNGVVTPIGLGTAVITAESLDGGLKASASIYVIPASPNVRADVVNSVIVSNDSSVALSSLPAMEYTLDGSGWTPFVVSSPPNLIGEHNVQIRYKANGDVLAGQIKKLYFNTAAPVLTGFTLAVGTNLGTKFTTVPIGNLKYVVGPVNAWYRPAIGEVANDYPKPLLANQDVYVTASQHIYIVSVDGNNKIIGWLDLAADSAKIAVPGLVAKWDFEAKTEFASDGSPANKAIKAVTLTGALSSGYATGATGSAVGAIASNSWIPTPSYWLASFDTTGYSYIQVSSKMYSSASGPKEFKLQYSLTGSTWIDVPNASFIVASAAWSNVLSNATLPASANNQSNVYIRWLNTSSVAAGGGTVASGGTNRLDDVVINGVPLSLAPNVSADDVNKTIIGIGATMEYNIGNTGWVTYNVSSPPNLNGNYSVQVRSSARGDVLPGQIKTLTFTQRTAAEIAGAITSIVAPLQDVTSLTLPTLANGYAVEIKSSDKPAVIQTDGTIIPPSAATTVTLVLEVTRTSDNSKASTGNIMVVVPAKTVIPLTAAEVAATITSIVAPLQDVTSLTLPTLANGYTVAIKSSDKPAVIQTDGTIIPPSSATTVTLILEVTRTSDNSKASTGNIVVIVPAKTVIPLTAAEVAATITSIVAPLQDVTSLTLPTLANGYTVAIKSSDKPAVIQMDGTITLPSSATTVTLVLEVTRTSDNSKASTGDIVVIVPAKTVIPLTAAEVAATITSIVAPQQDATSLTLPTLANGYTVAIKSSSNTAVIGLNGTITPPSAATMVTLVLEVTRTSDNSKASTGNIVVIVPAKTVIEPTAAEVAATITSIVVQQDALSLTLPTVANGYTVAIKSSSDIAVIGLNGTITPPTSVALVTLVLEVTKISDNSKANTGNILVAVPPKTVIPLTAAEVAATITSIMAPQQDATTLTLPTLANGYTVAIKSSSNTAVIGLNGLIIPPSSTTTVTLVLEVTSTTDNTKASTGSISVIVPAKSVQPTPTPSPVGTTPTPVPTPTPTPTPTSTPTPTPSNDGKAETIATVKSDKLVNNGNGGKSTVEVPANTTEVKLPSNTAELLGNNKLEITSDKITLNVPSDLIKQLEGKFTLDELKDSTISLKFDTLSAADAKDIAAKGGSASNATVKLAGDVYEFSLSITSVDGKVEKLAQFDQPITIRLKVDPTLNPKLIGVYYISDSGKLELVQAELINGEMVAQISHFSKYAVLEYKKTFNDLATNHWAFNVVQELAAKQMVNGTSDTAFEPERAITRAEFTAMLVKALNLTKEGDVKFADVSANDWYAKAVSIAYQAGIVNGKSTTTFDPNGKITREEMVTMIMHAYELLKGKASANASTTFADESKVSSWALGYLKSASALNLIHGRTANQFVPKGTTTRAEAAQIIYNLLPNLK